MSRSLRFVLDRVRRPYGCEGLPALPAGDAGAAMDRAVPVTGPCDVEGDVHLEAHADDLLFRLSAQRHEDLHGGFVVGPEAQMEHAVQEVEELRARVGERFGVDSVVTTDEVPRGIEFRVVAREAVENQVPSRDVPFGRVEEEAVLEALLPEIVDLLQERQGHRCNRTRFGPRAQRPDRAVFSLGGTEVVEGERLNVPALLFPPPKGDPRNDPPGEEDNRPFHSVTPKPFGLT